MTDRRNGPDEPRGDRDLERAAAPDNRPGGRVRSADILSLHSSPAFDLWLERQMRKLADASVTPPRQSLVDLIRGWPNYGKTKDPK
jgi:hypothetical protein